MPTMPTPISANGRLTLDYTITGEVHHFRVRVSINNLGGPSPYLFDQQLGGTIQGDTATAQMDTLISPFWDPTVSFGQWLLEKYDSGAYIPLDSWVSTAVGSHAAGVVTAEQSTFTFKDVDNQFMKFLMFEQSFVPPARETSFTSGTLAAFVNDMINPAAGHLGSWVRGRGNEVPFRVVSLVTTLNRKLRRRRGVA